VELGYLDTIIYPKIFRLINKSLNVKYNIIYTVYFRNKFWAIPCALLVLMLIYSSYKSIVEDLITIQICIYAGIAQSV
jgi:hypothetical protein